MRHHIRKLLQKLVETLLIKCKYGSPLVEEGLLLGLAVITLSVIMSMIAGLLSGVEKTFNMGLSGFNTMIQQVQDSWEKVLKFFGFG